MRIHQVVIEGFGPFKERQVVDLDAFSDDGMFLITGNTGAGKSSVLDAVTFALFGRVPRYGARLDEEVRSKFLADSADPARVEVEFSEGAKRYRVWRTATFTKPGNKNPTPGSAEVIEITDGEERVIAARKMSDVGAAIDAIVQLNADQFTQVILLAQGEFQRFLVADSKERRQVLRKLFNTGRFLDYAEDLDARAAELQGRLARSRDYLSGKVSTLADQAGSEFPADAATADAATIRAWATQLATAKNDDLAAAKAAVDAASERVTATSEALDTARQTAAAQQRQRDAVARSQKLAEQRGGIDADRARLEAARRAATVTTSIEARDEAAERVAAADSDHAAAVAQYREHDPDGSIEVEILERWVEDLTGEAGRLVRDVQREGELEDLYRAATKAKQELTAADDHLRRCQAAVTKLRTDAPDFIAQIEEHEAVAATLGEAEQALATARQRFAAATNVATLAEHIREAEVDHLTARKRAGQAGHHYTVLIERRLAEQAGNLAELLIAGEPCAVCGSTDHPAPAALAADRVTEVALAAAAEAEEEAEKQAAHAAEHLARLTALRDTEVAAMGEGTLESITAAKEQAAAAVSAANRAAKEVSDLRNRQEQHRRHEQAANEAVAQATIAHTQAAGEEKAARALHQKEAEAVSAARGDFASVDDRLRWVIAHRDAAKTLAGATTALQAAHQALATATTKADAAVAEQRFADAAEVMAAVLPVAEHDLLDARIQEHERETRNVAEILAEPQLQDLPAEPVDVTPFEAAHRDASQALHDAVALRGSATTVATAVASQVRDIEAILAEAGEVGQEHALVGELADVVNGRGSNTKRMALETYALAADLEEIVAQANVLLGRMTADRYELVHTDERARRGAASGLGLQVVDAYNGEARPPESLSGGEKFQASLALALGLAEVVTSRNGGVRLDTLFIDEGFGHLDDETLAEVLDTIDVLREGGRTIGLISHVGQVKERIRNHLHVAVDPQGWSVIRAN